MSIRPCQARDEARRQHPHEAGEAEDLGAARPRAARPAPPRTPRGRRRTAGGRRRPSAARAPRPAPARRRPGGWRARGRPRPDAPGRPCRAPAPACSSPPPEIRIATRLRLTGGPRSARPAPAATRPMRRTRLAGAARAAAASASARSARDDGDQADAAVEGLQHLGLGDAGPRRAASRRPAAAPRRRGRSRRRGPSGRTRGRFSVSPPPVMCASAAHPAGARAPRSAGAHVDAGRRRAAPRRACRRRRGEGASQPSPARLDDPAHQAEAVRMHAARGEPEQHVAGGDPARQRRRRAPSRRPRSPRGRSRRAAYIPGISAVSPPTSAAPASAQPAAMPSITRRGGLDVEPAGGEVVEEEQRLGALADQVVDAHGDEVDADGVEPPGLDREPELGADAVGRGDQDRVGVARGPEVEERAEAAEPGHHPGPRRRAPPPA